MQTEEPGRARPRWDVTCHLVVAVVETTTVVLHISPARGAGAPLEESLVLTLDGQPVTYRTHEVDHGGLVQVLRSPPGRLAIDLQATIDRTPQEAPPAAAALDPEQLSYLRQSRYCPSDLLAGFAAYELGHLEPGHELLTAVGDWVGSRLTYQEGTGGPLDSAVDALFAGRGVCRDFAHLAITMLRALDVPARLVSVYASGLTPMDFHAVVEAHVDGRWWVLDPTRLAPRPALLRVATGRDAADAAFLTVIGGQATLQEIEVSAVTDGDLPVDDHRSPVWLASSA